MLEIDRKRVGERSAPVVQRVERGAIRKFASALQSRDPLYFSPQAAQEAGYRDVIAPPTFPVTLLPWDLPGVVLPKAGILHGEQEFTWGESICAGDDIAVSGWVDDVKTRSGRQGRMTIITVRSEGFNQHGAEVFQARAVLIVTEEASHEHRG